MPATKYNMSGIDDMVMLSILQRRNRAYGVEIHDAIEDETGKTVSIPAVYMALERLEDAGYVRSALAEPTPRRGGRSRKYFTVTGAGVRALREEFRSRAKLWKGLEEVLDL